MWRTYFQVPPATGPWIARFHRGSGWPLKLALAAAATVVFVPLLFLIVLGAIAGVAVFMVASAVALLAGMIHSLFGGLGGGGGWENLDDGRRNVRVIPPQ